MKHEENVRTWRSFLRKLDAIQRANPTSNLLFRGHGDARWSLETTLERRGLRAMPVFDYYRAIQRLRPQIESFTGRAFELPPHEELEKLFRAYEPFSLALTFGGFPAYSSLIYTRHHGFPSPLLDWTRSAYIAAFFAFAGTRSKAKKRSIYVWAEPEFNVSGTNTPELKRLGPYVTTHRRHLLQQCDYTVCATFSTQDSVWRFTSQEEALGNHLHGDYGDDAGSDEHRLWKFNLPSSERLAVLRFLDGVNLNAYSLFGSEEGLMDTLAFREFDLR